MLIKTSNCELIRNWLYSVHTANKVLLKKKNNQPKKWNTWNATESWKLNQSYAIQKSNHLKGYNYKELHVPQQISSLYRKLKKQKQNKKNNIYTNS